MTKFNQEKLIRDALGSPIPSQYWDDVKQTFIIPGGEGVDFTKKKLIRDAVGAVIPQYWDGEKGGFAAITSGNRQSKEIINQGRLMTDFSRWQLWYGVVSQDTEQVKVGQSSVKVTTNDANTTSASRLRSVQYNLSKTKTMMMRFYVEDVNKLSNIELRFSSVDNMASYLSWKTTKWKVISGWNEVMIPLSKLNVVGNENLNNTITTLQISVTGDHTFVVFDGIYINRKSKGNVLLHFDDGFISQYTNAFPLMLARGFVGSVGVISGSVGTTGYMNLAQLKELYNYGWDLFNHTVTHQDLSTLSINHIQAELDVCREWLISNGFSRTADFVAYPYGGYNNDVLEVMKNYKLGRSIREEYEILPPIQPHLLKTVILYNNVEEITFRNAIDYVIETGATVIFLHHKVEDVNTDEMNYPTEKFKNMLDYLYSKQEELNVLSWSEYANMF
ncbi:polysaccharide deacetylase family protein [Lysinibacillus sp. NPDC056959]|uniref:polysaccharide deacetylase family protein n=1 Tax=Lysinibacillus sp. NPDC056959 TaxID=3345981 RepID=UPI003633224E